MISRASLLALLVPAALSLAACSDSDAPLHGGPIPVTGLAVVNSDFTSASASVSLVDPATGMLARDACITSGTTTVQLTTALSSDIVLPSQPQPGNKLLIIDRKNATLTWVDPKTCTVSQQLSVASGFESNPQDVVTISATKAYVLRAGVNPANGGEGSDLLIIDPTAATSTAMLVGRIDLRLFTTAGTSNKPILPAPARAQLIGGKVYVVLGELSADYNDAGPGRVVIIDPTTDAVTGMIDIPSFKNCGSLASTPLGLMVTCGGLFSAGAQRAAQSGTVWIDIASSPPTINTVPASRFGGRAVSFSDVAAFSATVGFTIIPGDFMGPAKDQLWTFSTAAGDPTMVYEAGAGFVLSGIQLSTAHKKLFIADASMQLPRVRVWDVSDTGTLTAATPIQTSTVLPPRYLGFYGY
jgi:hypothetical protein